MALPNLLSGARQVSLETLPRRKSQDKGRRMIPQGRWLSLVALVLLLGYKSHARAQELTQEDVQRIAFEAQRAFEHIVQLWKDQRAAELYTFGTFTSQADISPEAFVRYMSYATRTLQCCWATLQNVSTRFVSPEQVYVRGRLGFKNREHLIVRGHERFLARGFEEEETLTFLVQYEDQYWRIDLFRILALSGIPLEIPGVPGLFLQGRRFERLYR